MSFVSEEVVGRGASMLSVGKNRHTQVRHLDRVPETRRSVLGYRGHSYQCQTDQLSADQCSCHYPLMSRLKPETRSTFFSVKLMNWDRSSTVPSVEFFFLNIWYTVLVCE